MRIIIMKSKNLCFCVGSVTDVSLVFYYVYLDFQYSQRESDLLSLYFLIIIFAMLFTVLQAKCITVAVRVTARRAESP